MKILGIQASCSSGEISHDSSAALVIDGKFCGMYEEERFNRIKHTSKFPINAINALMKQNNINLSDIDYICCGGPSQDIEKILNIKIPQTHILYHSHHMGHICDAFYTSGFKSAACLVIDGCGDANESITLAHIKNNEIKILKRYPILTSLGEIYGAATGYAHLGEFGEGKLMGLSSYGNDRYENILEWNDDTKEIKALFTSRTNDDLQILYNQSNYLFFEYVIRYINNFFEKKYYPYNNDLNTHVMSYANLAKTIQENYNEIVLHLIKYLKELTNEDNLILAGGCIQNCIGNNIIVESNIFKNVYGTPTPNDAGASTGYAFWGANVIGENIQNIRRKNSYSTIKYELNDNFIKKYNIVNYDKNKIINILKDDNIILWFQNESENGPRALGHRSILANPSDRNILNVINNEIKHRENWRPLAPIVPAELFDLLFDVKSYDLTEFMLRTLSIRKEWRSKIPAVCHIDGTTRPQRLERDSNPELYDLIMDFYKETGIPCLVNTSFNDRGQPIIETPEEGIEFFNTHEHIKSIIFNSQFMKSRS